MNKLIKNRRRLAFAILALLPISVAALMPAAVSAQVVDFQPANDALGATQQVLPSPVDPPVLSTPSLPEGPVIEPPSDSSFPPPVPSTPEFPSIDQPPIPSPAPTGGTPDGGTPPTDGGGGLPPNVLFFFPPSFVPMDQAFGLAGSEQRAAFVAWLQQQLTAQLNSVIGNDILKVAPADGSGINAASTQLGEATVFQPLAGLILGLMSVGSVLGFLRKLRWIS